ncbi:MAG TPA: universal stress protein [Longimicrobiaceae bacterium]|nr:universal stress protein [Longimicrobiaceae bacterium]
MTHVPTRSILAASDLTPASDGAVRTAAAIAERTGAALHLLHACDFAVVHDLGGGAAPSFEGHLRAAAEALEAQAARAVPAGVEVASREVTVYAKHHAILEQADALGAELVVLGPHRGRGRVDVLWGSTAERVVRAARVPCLVARGRMQLPFRRVVVPVDLASPAHAAAEVALGWCGPLGAWDGETAVAGAEVRVVHVVPRIFEGGDPPFERAVVGPRLHPELEEVVEAAGGAPGVHVSEEVLWGSHPAPAITRYAREEGAELLVVAAHGHGPVRRLLQGSVSAEVARAAHCPVLLLPPALWRPEEAPAWSRGPGRLAEPVPAFG